jgi:hypothetical protein
MQEGRLNLLFSFNFSSSISFSLLNLEKIVNLQLRKHKVTQRIKFEVQFAIRLFMCRCDGSHAGTNFKPQKWTAETTGSKKFCRCKLTATAPLCDNSHVKKLGAGQKLWNLQQTAHFMQAFPAFLTFENCLCRRLALWRLLGFRWKCSQECGRQVDCR